MRRPLLLYAGVCLALAVAVFLFAFHTTRGRAWDSEILRAATAGRDIPSVQSASDGLIETISIGSLVLLGGGLVAVALLLGRARAALGAVLVIGAANGTTQALKPLIGDDRFPSGHATVAMSLALATVLVVSPSWKLLAGLVGGAYAAGVGVSLVIQAAHYPSDVAAGYLVAGAWAGAVCALLPEAPDTPREGSARAGFIAAAAAVTAFVVAVAIAVVEHPGIVVRVEDRTKLVFALAVLAGLALAVTVAQAIALRSASTTRSWSPGSMPE
ncbi:MAG: phosphatase PAP2 family protein [Actinobacteria bacterium]|nr:phosphatase PAP2 family protein [Actinomycetota bacterium]